MTFKKIPYVRHYNPLLIRNSYGILTIHKAKGHSTKMNFKKWVKSIQTAGYNGARTVYDFFIDTTTDHLQGPSWQIGFFDLALTDGNTEVRVRLKVVLKS